MREKLFLPLLSICFILSLVSNAITTDSTVLAKTCSEDTWSCSDWGACSQEGTQERICTLTDDCHPVDTPSPSVSQSCDYVSPACTSWTYSDWSACANSQQARTILSSSPENCTGGDPVLNQSCTVEFPTCTSRIYSDWSACANDQQTRTILTSSPENCTGGNPILNQACTVEFPTCTSWTYSDWSACANDQQTRTILSSLPPNCTGGSPILTQICILQPNITSISPNILIPGETIVTINGENFGTSYVPYKNQICFGSSCIYDSYINDYLQSWSDKEIVIKVPDFVNESGTIGVKLYSPSLGYYDYVDSPIYAVKAKPIIEWYYPEMAQGETYVFSGYNFGNSRGRVAVNGINAEIVTWDDKNVQFKVPKNASSGEIYIENADGIKSQRIQISIIIVKTYSNDEYSSFQWYLETLNVDKAWNITEGSSDVIVAVIDSGVDTNHEDLKHAIWTNADEIPNNRIDDDNNGYIDDIHGWDFILNSNSTTPRGPHGTAVASLIVAKKDNGMGIAGVSPNVTIMPLNVGMSDEKSIGLEGALHAIKYAVDNGATIINLSFGGTDNALYYEDVIQYAYDNNVLVIAATGNEYLEFDDNNYGPVCTDLKNNAVIGVAAINKENLKASFSNYGPTCVDLSAPGQDIAVASSSYLNLDDPYISGEGTSFSTPLVTGIAALVKSEHPAWNVEEIKSVLLSTAENIDYLNQLYTDKLGEGIPNAYAALTASRPNVSYNYNPRTSLSIEETDVVIEIENPEITPIEKIEPIKNDSVNEDEVNKILQNPFSDTEGHKNEQAITYLQNIGIINGYPDGTFRPEDYVNRAQLLKIVIEGKGVTPSADEYKNCFPDVKTGWFMPYVCYAKEQGWIKGYKDGTFKPSQTVSKVEAIKILLESQGIDLPETVDVKPFDDIGITDWSAPYVTKAKELGILEETGSILGKAIKMTRAGICENLYRLLVSWQGSPI